MSNWFKTTSIYWFKKPTAISTPTNKKKKKKSEKKNTFSLAKCNTQRFGFKFFFHMFNE